MVFSCLTKTSWSRSEKILEVWGGAKNFGCLELVPELEIGVSAPQSWFQLLRTLPLTSTCKFSRAGCKLVSLSHMAFPPVLFMSRRLQYLLSRCSCLVEICSVTYFEGNFIGNVSLTLPKISGNPHSTWSKRLTICDNKIWHRLHHRFRSRWKVPGRGIAFACVSYLAKKHIKSLSTQSNFWCYLHNRKTF